MNYELLLSNRDHVQHWLGSAGFLPAEFRTATGESSRTWKDAAGREAIVHTKFNPLGGDPPFAVFTLMTDDTSLATEIKLAIPEAFK